MNGNGRIQMKNRCKATTVKGDQCDMAPLDSTGFCRIHHLDPTKRSTGSEFEESTLKVLRLLGYEVKHNVTLEGSQIDLLAEYKTGVIPLRLMVECKDEDQNVGIEAIKQFSGALSPVRGKLVDKGLLVAKSGFTRAAKELGDAAGIQLVTFNELANRLVDFDAFIEQVIQEFEGSPSSSYYVDLPYALTEGYTTEAPDVIQRPLDSAVKRLLSEEGKSRIALLGNFGTGKTTWCKKFARDLALEYKKDPTSRIPLVVSLADYETKLDIQQLITNTFQFRYGVRIDLTICQELQRLGRLCLLFDGFDEMATRVDPEVVRENLREISKVARIPENLFILTCRTHFFRDKVQAEVLASFETLFIPEWGEAELTEYLQKRFGDEWITQLEKIRGTHNLAELAQTPLFLDMITETLPRLGDKVRRSELYEEYTSAWVQGQSARRGARLDSADRKRFVTELAIKLYTDARSACHYSEFASILQSRFSITDASQLDYLQSDVRSCTFLTRNEKGDYEFKHKSFMDFFVAKALKSEIEAGSKSLLRTRSLPLEVGEFLIELMSLSLSATVVVDWYRSDTDSILKENLLRLIVGLRLKLPSLPTDSTAEGQEHNDIVLFLQGDAEAFNKVVHRFKAPIIGFFVRKGHELQTATTLAYDVFLYALENPPSDTSPSTFRNLLQRIARTIFFDTLRSEQRIYRATTSLDAYLDEEEGSPRPSLVDGIANPAEELCAKELKQSLQMALSKLSDTERIFIQLTLLDGCSDSDAAANLGMSFHAVKDLRRKALSKLRNHLAATELNDVLGQHPNSRLPSPPSLPG